MKLLKLTVCLAFIFLFADKTKAQTVPPKLAQALQHTLDSMRQVLNVKSLSAAVQLPDGAMWAGVRGISSQSPLDSVTAEDVYAIGSVGKTLTAACVLQLADEGALSLDDSLHHWLDTFQYINPNITIRQLLRHQSGIFDILSNNTYQPTMGAYPDSVWHWEDAIKTFIRPPVFQPGASWGYSNTNYLLLGLIIEKAGGKSYHTALRERFFTPLGMTSVALPPYEMITLDVANLWLDLDGNGSTDDSQDLLETWDSFNSSAAPAGSHYSTARDMATWMRAYMRGDLLSPARMAEMRTVVNAFPNGTKYGLGVMNRSFAGLNAYGHGGDVGYAASVFYFPEKDISIAVLNNDSKPGYNSWTLIPTVTALLKTYLECEAVLNDAADLAVGPPALVAYPNPFGEVVNIAVQKADLQSPVRFVLTDAQGRAVGQTQLAPGAQTAEIQGLTALPVGLYFLRGFSGDQPVGPVKLVKGSS